MTALPPWVAWLLAFQTLAMTVALVIAVLIRRSFQAGSLSVEWMKRVDTLEQAWQKANPELSKLASRVQQMATVEELRRIFVARDIDDERRDDIDRRLANIEQTLTRDPRSRMRRTDK